MPDYGSDDWVADPRGEGYNWRDDAACLTAYPELWFPNKGESTIPGKRICSTCEVAAECLAYAIRNDINYGIYGGKSVRERMRISSTMKA